MPPLATEPHAPTSPLEGEVDPRSGSGEGSETPATPSSTPSLRPSVTSPLPVPDAALLSLFLQLNLNLETLAAQTNLPLLDLLAWADSPPIRAQREALARLRQESLDNALVAARLTAIRTLAEIAAGKCPDAATPPDPIERRRAATTLMRRAFLAPGGPPLRGGSSLFSSPAVLGGGGGRGATEAGGGSPCLSPRATGGSSGEAAPASAEPPAHPNTEDSPAPILSHALETLRALPTSNATQASDALSPLLHESIRTRFYPRKRFADRLAASGLLDDLDHHASQSPPRIEPDDEHATAKICVHAPRGLTRYTFHFTRNPLSGATGVPPPGADRPYPGPWRLTDIHADTS